MRQAIAAGVAVLFAVQSVGAAPAAPGAAPASGPAPASAAASAQAPPRLVIHVFHDGAAVATARRFARGIEKRLQSERRVVAATLDEVLLDAAADERALAEAEASIENARKAVQELDLAQATRLLKEAIEICEKRVHRLASRPKPMETLRVAFRELAVVRFLENDQEGARQALRRARVLEPTMAFDRKTFPPKMRRLFTEVALLQDELGTGKVQVTTDPPGAEVLVNGVAAGIAPFTAENLAAGHNYFTFLMPGFVPTTVAFEVTGGEEQKLEQPLARFDDDPAPLLQRTRSALGEPSMPSPMRDLARRLGADLLLLGFVREEAENADLALYLYDARVGRLLRSTKKSVARAESEAAGAAMCATLDPGAAHVVEVSLAIEAPKPKRHVVWDYALRFRRWKWFWPTVAVAGALVVTGIVLGVTVHPQSGIDPRWVVVLGNRVPGWSF